MRRFWNYITDARRLTIAGLIAMAALFYLGAEVLELALIWALGATVLMLLVAGGLWWWRRRRARGDAEQLAQAIAAPVSAETIQRDQSLEEVKAIREGLLKAIDTIKGSRLGIVSGARALYELPWYMIIGNPAAGKSTAITNSGLQFPFADGKVVQGVAGTRNCDWFFTPDGILLDTAGRYSVMDEHRAEWFGFLDLLKKYRRRAPINGILIAVSIAELRGDDPEAGIQLARGLRKRVQDLIERLEIFAPVYVVFTKADLVAGFGEFFAQAERAERERVWGATMPYKRKNASQQILAFFDQTFDELCDGLKALSIANMGQQRRDRMEPGVFTFPLEFSTLRTPLRAFLAALFEENPYQFKPLFRGYYFTSALQEGLPVSAQSQRVAQRFGLQAPQQGAHDRTATGHSGFFLFNLFRNVIFADKDLVSQYASRHKVRLTYAVFFTAMLLLGGALGGWGWSYLGNRQLVSNVQADLDQVIKLQQGRLDLQSRLEALAILQDRIEQLERYRDERPWSLRMGLYQGELLEQKLRAEYFAGVKEVMVRPVVASLEELLTAMNTHADQLRAPGAAAPGAEAPGAAAPAATEAAQFQQASAVNVDDAYNALKTYLMLADKSHAEPGHLNDQLTRYWRGWLENQRGAMSREQMIQAAERLLTFYLAQVADPAWPRIEPKLALVDQSRDHLRRVVRGMPARERVYADIRARANTRFPAMTVSRMVGEQDQALVAGSHAIAGAYTREAWEKYVQPAFREAAARELQSTDWVLKSATRDDLTLEGSPEQIQKGLTDLYKADYAREWQKFVTGVTIANLDGFDAAVVAMNRLGDPQSSPIAKLLTTIDQQTSWDNPSVMSAELKAAQSGFVNWIKNRVLSRGPSQVNVNLQLPQAGDQPMGPIGREFAGVAKLLAARDKDASLLGGYLQTLSKLRGRLNQLKNQGDPGPGARQFMQQTLEGTGSELADALRHVDEQMLNGMSDSQKQAIRPLLVRPLMQTFAVLIAPAEAEINKTWLAQVVEPFRQTLADKYPFAPNGRTEAAGADIARVFGPDGLVARFATTAMGPLVVRRGDVLAPRTWADMGIALAPQTATRFAGWIAPLNGAGGADTPPQTVFQIQPMPAPGALEYVVDIDGQQLRYRNTPPQWAHMVHPGPTGAEGARITATSVDGRSVDVFNQPGPQGLKMMIDAAAKQRREGGVFELRWTTGTVTVAMGLKIISSPESGNDDPEPPAPLQRFKGMQLPETVVGAGTVAGGSTAVAAIAAAGTAP
ncbi:UNVERIFIED_ORG: type VI secretion system protein ImpL [Zoogloea ramigera]|uniref:Type VI secretion system membrane subunit TssM n=1 Tax=Duganella zoogloeoides TaxID=75659 RepID=A0ABZ0XUN0_9BURK|nr:type VI secretion system membrane subunit TssM [Duganella zoogloeoides]WQH02987.1 type VI secretion system membrane subunit TssM [Duganella zoogloeoides]